MNKSSMLINTIVVLALYSSNAMTENSELEHANKIANLVQEQMSFVLEKYGNKLKAKAMLDACKLTKLSKSVEVSTDEIMSDLAEEYQKLPSHKKLKRDSFSLVAINNAMRITYMYGFMSATQVIVETNPGFCLTAVQFAEKVMSEKSDTQ